MKLRDSNGRITTKRLNLVAQKWLVRAHDFSKSDFVIEWGNRGDARPNGRRDVKASGAIRAPVTLIAGNDNAGHIVSPPSDHWASLSQDFSWLAKGTSTSIGRSH